MNGKRKMLATVASICAVLAATTVIASSQASHTPLYTFRMEQASSEMNFLPTTVNGFTYTTENGYTLNSAAGNTGILEVTVGRTCEGTCIEPTCPNTCWSTCVGNPTCSSTCPDTCGATCDTCDSTCATCDSTCIGDTCESTCGETCGGPICDTMQVSCWVIGC